MKLESLKSSKFEVFKENQICSIENIIGGQRLVMSSWYNNGAKVGTDSGDLTQRGGGSYDGQPGDGTAGDWDNVCWNAVAVSIGDDGLDCGYDPADPPAGAEADFWNAVTSDIYLGAI